jgi:hypothetical protein
MATFFPRAALGAALAWGLWAGLAQAQVHLPTLTFEPAQGPCQGPPAGQVQGQVQQAAPGAAPSQHPPFPKTHPGATELPPGAPPVDNSPSKRPIRDWLRYHRPLGCWASFNGYSCSSVHSELAFLFGSCRTFYGEPCLKGPPPSALPPWMAPNFGNGNGNGNGNGGPRPCSRCANP